MMKNVMMAGWVLAILAVAIGASADPMEELIESLNREYESLVPAPYSSVGTDYPTRQAALGALYTARSMGLIYQQAQEMLSGQRELNAKYDEIIAQNQQIIRLLSVIAERVEPVAEVPGTPGLGASGQ